ncbi:MAG TPA: OmpA family protein [Polyangiaceae bacterium]|nr:OmpA family protein [Polyangiaceae bacterium]
MSKSRSVFFGTSVALLGLSYVGPAAAQTAQVEVEADGAPHADAQHRAWLQAGVFGGLFFPSKQLSVYRKEQEAFKSPASELGARLAFLPSRYLGLEAEALAGGTRTKTTDEPAGLWAARGHVLLQLPLGSFTPFVLGGAGALGAGSNPTGSDIDPAVHLGVGAKLAFDDFVGARFDVRDVISAKYSADDSDNVHNPEVLLGLTFNLDFYTPPPKPAAPPPDQDGDGVEDAKDRCPAAAGPAPEGCPPPPDSDGDGFIDDKDACPAEKGIAPVGCPDRDPDKDCVEGAADKCPDEPGIQPDGCPDRDPDRDGVLAPNDKCPAEQETKNGFEDSDGCPDTLPEKVKKFSGVIPGIEFDLGKSSIRPGSTKILDEAAGVLNQYPDMRVAVSGHTDNVGDRKKNVDLSQQRADSVKQYLVSRGVSGARIDTRGAGPDEPLADNKEAAGRQKNRRIEFKLLSP